MVPTDLLDRHAERSIAERALARGFDDNVCLTIAGRSGVGKSKFTSHLANGDPTRAYVRITIPRNVSRTLQSGSYLREIAKVFDGIAREEPSVPSFIDKGKKEADREILSDLASAAADIIVPQNIRSVIVKIYKRWTATDEEDWAQKLNLETPENLLHIREFCTSFFQEASIGLVVENAQNIDEFSLAWMENILTVTRGHALLFEWTVDGEYSPSELRDLKEQFEPTCSVWQLILLDKLPLEYALRLIPDREAETRQWLTERYSFWDGNLIPLVDLDVVTPSYSHSLDVQQETLAISNGPASISLSSAAKAINLKQEEQILLFYLVLRGGEIDVRTLLNCHQKVAPNFSELDLKERLVKLEESRLILSAHGSKIAIRHDSIVDELATDLRFVKCQTVAAGNIRSFCEAALADQLQDGQSRHELLYFLLRSQIYLQDAIGALRSINSICALRAVHQSPAVLCDNLFEIVELYDDFDLQIPPDQLEGLILEILAICIRTRIFGPAKQLIEKQKPSGVKPEIAVALVNLGIEKPDIAIIGCKEVLSRKEISKEEKHFAQIVAYVAQRHLGNLADGQSEWKVLLSEVEYSQNSLAGFVFRNAEMFLNPVQSIPFLIKSVRRFEADQNIVQLAYSLNALAGQLIRMNKCRMARPFLLNALKFLKTKPVDSLSVENNLAVLFMKLGDKSHLVGDLLSNAAIALNDSFSRLAVSHNLTRYYDLNDDVARVERSAESTLHQVENRTVNSPQVNNSVVRSLRIISMRHQLIDLVDRIDGLGEEVKSEQDVYTSLSAEEDDGYFVLLSNWSPDLNVILAQAQ